jgi:hypothetical protein
MHVHVHVCVACTYSSIRLYATVCMTLSVCVHVCVYISAYVCVYVQLLCLSSYVGE